MKQQCHIKKRQPIERLRIFTAYWFLGLVTLSFIGTQGFVIMAGWRGWTVSLGLAGVIVGTTTGSLFKLCKIPLMWLYHQAGNDTKNTC